MIKTKSKFVWMHDDIQDLLFNTHDKLYKVAYGGRYGSKTTGFEDGTIKRAIEEPGTNILCVRGTQTSIKDSLMSGIKKRIFDLGVQKLFDLTHENIIKTIPLPYKGNPKDLRVSKYIFMGAVAYDSFRSITDVNICWIDEAHVIKEKAWDVIDPSIRSSGSTEIWITFNPESPEDIVYKLFVANDHPDAKVVKINYTDNIMLPEKYIKKAEYMKKTNLRKYNHIYLGQLNDKPEGAYWDEEDFIYMDVDTEDLEKIIVAVDPSGDSKDDKGDQAGIVVAGKIGDKAWVLADETTPGNQLKQAKTAIKMYYKWDADSIVIEKNGVGEGMKTIIHQIDKNIPIKTIHAHRGKTLRSPPIAALYKDNRVYHTKIFPELQYEMTSFTGVKGDKSPNRLDACVYAVKELLINKKVLIDDDMVEVEF